MDVNAISKSSIRILPGGFAWTFTGKNTDTGRPEVVTLRFEFCWFKTLAKDLHTLLDFRDHETEAARQTLLSRE
jgi:hypothetical protein